MAATVNLYESNGGSAGSPGSVTLLTNLNFSNADTANTTVSAASNPLIIPSSGTSYSTTKWIRIGVSVWGGSASIGNFKIWNSTGSPWATTKGIGCNGSIYWAGTGYSNYYISTYGHGVGGGGAKTIPYTSNGLDIVGAKWETGGGASQQIPLTALQNLGVAGSSATNLLSGGGVPQYSDYMALAMWFTSTVAQGDAGAQTISYQWDES